MVHLMDGRNNLRPKFFPKLPDWHDRVVQIFRDYHTKLNDDDDDDDDSDNGEEGAVDNGLSL
jgi:hypothetical protein